MLLMLGSGLFWMATYVLIIRRGFLDRTYGMPLVALCTNLSWEFIFSFVYPHVAPYIYTNVVWLSLDVVILIQFLKFGPSEFPSLSTKRLYLTLLVVQLVSFCTVLLVSVEFDDTYHGAYAAFGQNLMISVLFIAMLSGRDDVRGQSPYIALSKMIGTALASLAFYLFPPARFEGSVLLPFLSAATFVFDLAYVALICQKCREQGIAPGRRA